MYHARFNQTHYDAGYKWGSRLYKNNFHINKQPTFHVTNEKRKFYQDCLGIYQKFYPEILEEIKGVAAGQRMESEELGAFLFSMYCFEFTNKCTCFACKDKDSILFGRNSDFFKEIGKISMNCIYDLENSYAFNGNTTAFIEMEDGINETGLAIGLTSVYPKIIEPGFNSGLLLRYCLEKCKSLEEVIEALHQIPIASQQTYTVVDRSGKMAVIECNCRQIEVVYPKENQNFVATANNFNSERMKCWRNEGIDDWRADDRYKTASATLQNRSQYSIDLIKEILSGKHGFMCHSDLKKGAYTIWSVVYDLCNGRIIRAEGNPSKTSFKEDKRFHFK